MSSNSYIIEIGTGRTTQPYDGRYVTTIGDPPPPDIGTPLPYLWPPKISEPIVGRIEPATIPQGWQCPVCKTVYAPSVTQCRCAIENAITLWDERRKEAAE